MKKVTRFYFPISILKGFAGDPEQSLMDILLFSTLSYAEAQGANNEQIEKVFNISGYRGTKFAKQRTGSIDKKQPFSSVGHTYFWDKVNEYRNGFPTKEDNAVLLFILAINSLSGKKRDKYIRTTKEMILARMAGEPAPNGELPEHIKPFSTRKMFDKIKNRAENEYVCLEFKQGKQRGITFRIVPYEREEAQEPQRDNLPF